MRLFRGGRRKTDTMASVGITTSTFPPGARQPRQLRRVPAIAAIAGVLAVLPAAERATNPADTSPIGNSDARAASISTTTGAPGSTWVCAAALHRGAGISAGILTISNPGNRVAEGVITALPDTATPKKSEVRVPARGRLELPLESLSTDGAFGLVVELDAGAAVVERGVSTTFGFDVSPCTSAGSSKWWFADGSTAKGDRLLLALANPYAQPAIVDLTVVAPLAEGENPARPERVAAIERPGEFQGIVVQPNRTVVVDIGQHVRRRLGVSTEVSVRSGAVVAEQTQLFGKEARRGVVITPGAPGLSSTLYFPSGFASPDRVERYVVFNPTSRRAVVQIGFASDGEFVEPLERNIPPRGRIEISSNVPADRVPAGVGHDVVIGTDSDSLVAQRTIEGSLPLETSGGIATPIKARRWLVGASSPTALTSGDFITVSNPTDPLGRGNTDVRVSIYQLAGGRKVSVPTIQAVEIRPGKRLAFTVTATPNARGPYVIEANRPVVVDRNLSTTSGFSYYIATVLS